MPRVKGIKYSTPKGVRVARIPSNAIQDVKHAFPKRTRKKK